MVSVNVSVSIRVRRRVGDDESAWERGSVIAIGAGLTLALTLNRYPNSNLRQLS